MKRFIINKIILIITMICIFFPSKIVGDDTIHAQQAIDYKESQNNNKQSLDPDNKSDGFDWEPFLYLFGILMSALMIVYQMNRQHRNNIDLQRENNRDKLKLDIYNEFREAISESLKKTFSMYSDVGSIVSRLKLNADFNSKGMPLLPLNTTSSILSDAHFASCKSIQDLIDLLDEYEIINPNLEIFQTAFSCAHFDILRKFDPFFELLVVFLPLSTTQQNQVGRDASKKIPLILSIDDLQQISDTANEYQEAVMDAASCIGDLAKEAQNIFLGGLFNHRLALRKPINPRMVVISTSPVDIAKLKKYFYEETEWGKFKKQAIEDAKAAVNKELWDV